MWRITLLTLLTVVGLQQLFIYIHGRAQRTERLAAANRLADETAQKDWTVGQLRVAARYLHQSQVQLDSTQRDRHQKAILAADFRLELRELRGQLAVRPALAGTTLRLNTGWGDLDTNGVHVDTDLQLAGVAAAPGQEITGTIDYHVTMAAIDLKVGASCEGPNARLAVTGPRWTRLTVHPGTISADVCNPAPPSLFSLRAPSLPVAGGLVAAGFFLRDLVRALIH